MKFTIITPSFNQLPYLKRCIASVADQVAPQQQGSAIKGRSSCLTPDLCPLTSGLQVHHHIQDGGSTDGTVDWLRQYDAEVRSQSADANNQYPITNNYRFTWSSERDAGMYDALNKGIERTSNSVSSNGNVIPNNQYPITNNSRDSVIAWLNCDEQYFPETLQNVSRGFEKRSESDFVYGDALLVDAQGRLLTCRKNPPLRQAYVLADHLYTQSAAMFFRSRIFASGLRFDTAWKAVGDCDLIVRAIKAGFRPAQMRVYLAACTMTGENLSRKRAGVEELRSFRQKAALQYRLGRPIWNLLRYSEKFIRGGFRQAVPLEYALYPEDSNVREKVTAQKADFRFRWDAHE